jgi:glycerol kinase
MRETTALGAAIAAGFAVDIWQDFEELKEINRTDRKVFKPQMAEQDSASMYKRWTKAVEMSRGWLDANESGDGKE